MPVNVLRAAEADCPAWTAPDAPRVERPYQFRTVDGKPVNEGPDFDTLSYYWKHGTWFKMPLGYRNPWPDKEWANKITDKESYKKALTKLTYKGFDPATGKFNPKLITEGGIDGGFSFWMPTLRYLDRNRWVAPGMRLCEAGREPPSADDYIVNFTIDWPFVPGSENDVVTRRFRLFAERQARGEPDTLQGSRREEHNLDGPITGTKRYNIRSDDGDLAVYLRCTPFVGSDKSLNPICDGWVWQRSMDLAFYLKFPSDKGQLGNEERWRKPVEAVIQLAKSWRQED